MKGTRLFGTPRGSSPMSEVIADENNEELYTHVYVANVFGIETFSKRVPYGDVAEVIGVIEDALMSTTQVAA